MAVLPRQQTDEPATLPPDDNVGPLLLAISGTLAALVLLTTTIRIYVRIRMRTLGWDDHTILLAATFALARTIIQGVQISYGNGRHGVYLSPSNVQSSNHLGFFALLLLFASMCFVKTSIILLLLRIKDGPRLKAFLYSVVAGLFVTNFGAIIIIIAHCNPTSAYWTGVGKCWDTRVRIYWIYATIAYSILTDFLCSFLPLLVVWRVRMPVKRKIAVWILMSLGLIATGFGIVRAASLGIKGTDLTWRYAIAAIWSNVELFLGIIAANLALSRSIYSYLRYGKNPDHTRLASSNDGSGAFVSAASNKGRGHPMRRSDLDDDDDDDGTLASNGWMQSFAKE